LRRGTHRSTRQLEQAIHDYPVVHNANPNPFVQTKTADDSMNSIKRFSMRIAELRHYDLQRLMTWQLESCPGDCVACAPIPQK
jgi:hypothetical protein